MEDPDDGGAARRSWWRPGLAVLLVLVGWAAWSSVALLQGARDGREGVRLARGAADAATKGALTDPQPLADLRRASTRFEHARRSLHALPLKGAGLLPVLGRQVRELQALSDGAVDVARISADTRRWSSGSGYSISAEVMSPELARRAGRRTHRRRPRPITEATVASMMAASRPKVWFST